MSGAIDRHEDAIVAVLELCDLGTLYPDLPITYRDALSSIARGQNMRPERLDQLVQVWCAVAGVEVPS